MSEEERAALRLTGRVELHLGKHGLVDLTGVEATTQGTFAAPEPPFRLRLEGPLAEMRKLRAVSPQLSGLLDTLAGMPDTTVAHVTLLAPDAHRARLAAALADAPGALTPDALLARPQWLAALFALHEYEAEGVGHTVV